MTVVNTSYPQKLQSIVGLKIIGEYTASKNKHILECQLCFKTFSATPKSKMANYNNHAHRGCPECTHAAKYRAIGEKNKKRLIDMGYNLIEDYKGLKIKVLLTNTNCDCGRSWKTTPERIFSGHSFCNPCNVENKSKRLQEFNEIKYQEGLIGKDGFERYQKEVRVRTERIYKQHHSNINPNNLSRGASGLDGAHHLDHIMSLKYCFEHDIPADICSHVDNLRVIPWKMNAVKWKRPALIVPKIMWKYMDSYEEKLDFIKHLKHNINGIKNYTKSDDDFFNLDLICNNVGILCHRHDDVYEQTTGSKSRLKSISEHFNNNKGIRVIHIFEDEWLHDTEIVIRKLSHILNNTTTEKIYARKCTVSIISSKDKSKFLNEYHIQGNDKSNISIGAYYNGELVSVMTFSRPKIFMKGKSDKSNRWELSRFATDSKYIVVGIASKLLKQFTRNNEWDEIYSFADFRWSDSASNLYLTLGFDVTTEPTLGYRYLVDGVRQHRWNYRKSEIAKKFPDSYDSKLTEYQNMLKLGYDRIWDCGIQKYSIINT